MTPRTKLFAVLAIGSIGAMAALSVLGWALAATHAVDDPAVAKRTGPVAGALFFALFLVLAFSLVPLGVRLFLVLQARIGNGDLALVRALGAHESAVTWAFWTIFALGLAIAAPVALRDLFGIAWRPGVGPSEGVLVARIGMSLDEMRQRSTLALARDVVASLTGDTIVAGSGVFDFEVADTGTTFPRCRYYFISTGTHGDRHVAAMSIGISTEKIPRTELPAAIRAVQERLTADGWRTGRFVYETEELRQLHGGVTESPRGFYWVKGDTLLRLESKRMDEERPGEDLDTAGEWIQFVELRPPSSEPDLRFE